MMTSRNGKDPALVVEAAIEQAIAGNVDAVWDAVPYIAALSMADFARAKSRLKRAMGDALNLNDLNSAVKSARLAGAATPEKSGDGRRLILPAEMQFADAVKESLAALAEHNKPARIFTRSGLLVEVIDGGIREVTPGHFRELLAEAINFGRRNTRGDVVDMVPPDPIVRAILERGRWPLPGLQAVTRAPVLRPDGSILSRPGYDPATELFFDPLPNVEIPPIPERPSAGDVVKARTLLDYMSSDFPFVSQADKANHLALLLTAVCRPAIRGPVPMAVIDAAKAGTGKSKLSRAPQVVVFSGSGFMGWPRSERELRAQITAQLRANPGGCFVIDNMPPGPFKSPTLARLLTSEVWEDRLLGENTQLRLRNLSTWVINGNNIMPAGDLPRRCYLIKLEATTSRPWERENFRIEDWDCWMAENAGRLFAALLTLARAWYQAGQPAGKAKTFNSYADWVRVVGGILDHAGIAGFLANNDELVAESEADEGWTMFLEELAAMPQPFTTSDVVEKMFASEAGGGLTAEAENLRAMLPEDLVDDRIFLDRSRLAKRLGQALRNQDGTRHGRDNIYVRRHSERARTGVRQWRIFKNDEEFAERKL